MCCLQCLEHIRFHFRIRSAPFRILHICKAVRYLLFLGAKLLCHLCGDLRNAWLLVFQESTDVLYGFIPKDGVSGLPQHGHVLKAYSVVGKVHVINLELAPVDMDDRAFGKVVLCRQVFALFVCAVLLLPGKIHVLPMPPQFLCVCRPLAGTKAGDRHSTARYLFVKQTCIENNRDSSGIFAVKLIVPMLLKSDQRTRVTCFQAVVLICGLRCEQLQGFFPLLVLCFFFDCRRLGFRLRCLLRGFPLN